MKREAKPTSAYDRVWALVRQVPSGRLVTYGQVARVVESCTPRMVGFAMAAAPDDVPWHRVINSRGRISARSDGVEDPRQRELLEREGILFDRRGVVDLGAYGWLPPI